ncbi:NAD-dependent epimerase/dehydratase family protein [Aequorivita sp. H23M31]|uniref:NAD-dependent epimerase/dehydratase family protein n=1 Tax=Aequorivita ciconiae TaxID=2494375 RepID=A0A410G4Y8_9FLAO|nr:NAD-dependent epimerase/dehydratase family protein [Aequorivita sp. H23M31]QAA82347.1 NAD-dependent epimerase/dehydratase family protein [Aequorivita sp. H23M31]
MILVTGGTGIVGAHLLYSLLEDNTSVRAIYRKDSDIHSIKKIFAIYTSEVDTLFNKIEWKEADIIDIPALTFAFKDVTHVYHCAALINFNPAKYKILKKINVEGTANIVNLCLANGVQKLCYVSSVATFGNVPNGQFINEETSWNPDERNNVYSITKYAAEMEVWRGTQEGLDAVIVNPGIIFGISPKAEGSGLITKLGPRGLSYYPSGGMGIVDVKDVVRAMKRLMDSEIKNGQYILVAENVYYKEILTKLALLYGKKPPSKKLSKPLMIFLSQLDWFSSVFFGTKRRLSKAMVRSMFSTSQYDSSKIKEQLHFEFTPLQETLKRIVDNSSTE